MLTVMRRKTVLVVDDAPVVVDVLTLVLTDLGYDVDGATDGETALRLFTSHRHDVVLTDLRMPRLSGWELIDALRRLAPAGPILAMSGSCSADDRSSARILGVPLLEKPLQLEDLDTAIAKSLEGSHAA